jgi:hypothetical protein
MWQWQQHFCFMKRIDKGSAEYDRAQAGYLV